VVLPPPTEPVPLTNILALDHPHRQQLLLGDNWTIRIDGKVLYTIPKNLLMAASSRAQKIFKQDPNATGIDLTSAEASPASVKHLIDWLIQVCHTKGVFRMPFRDVPLETMAVLRAGEILGMKTYTGHIYGSWKDYVMNSIADYDEISAIEAMALSTETGLFNYMANHLAHVRYLDKLDNAAEFNSYLSAHPKLRDAMAKIDSRHAEVREARYRNWASREEDRKARKHARIQAARAHRKQEQALKAELRDILNGKNGGSNVHTVTAEQAALLRRR
jgi:hypothetical protein